jgi:hypothetical protein
MIGVAMQITIKSLWEKHKNKSLMVKLTVHDWKTISKKTKEAILNNKWDIWWETQREQNIKVGGYKPSLPAAYFKKETESSPLVEVTIPVSTFRAKFGQTLGRCKFKKVDQCVLL